jgi:hypothetical protein
VGPTRARVDLGAPGASVRLHREALGRSQRSLLTRLAPLARQHGFYLAGGTALALQLGHRRSVDFDWFREDPIDDPLRLAAELRTPRFRLETERVERGTLHGRAGGIRVSFLEYRYPLLRPPLEVEGLRLAALEDIAAMKLAAVAQRGSKKDFIDVFALGRRFGLDDMLASYRKKYGVEDVGHVLVSLAYFDDADRERTPMLLQRQSWPGIKATIRGWVTSATRAGRATGPAVRPRSRG